MNSFADVEGNPRANLLNNNFEDYRVVLMTILWMQFCYSFPLQDDVDMSAGGDAMSMPQQPLKSSLKKNKAPQPVTFTAVEGHCIVSCSCR